MYDKGISIREKLIRKLEDYFGDDRKRINHARDVLHFAEELLKEEKADRHIVIPASILHDIGIKEAEKKYGSSAGNYQEKEGPPIARSILLNAAVKKDDIDEICGIIAHHHSPGKITTMNFKVLNDADWMVNLKDAADISDKSRLKKMIDKVFLTATGKELAAGLYIKQ